jgi:two-component system NarL family sensor kinase
MDSNNNDILVMIISATIVLLIMLCFIVFFLFLYKHRQARHNFELAGIKEQFNQEILKTQLEIKEQTLKTISEEIHDNVGQVLSLVVLHLSSVELEDPLAASAKIETTTNLVKKVVADLRNLSKTLDSDNITRAGVIPLIRSELEILDKTGIYHTCFQLDGKPGRLIPSHEIIVYRIIQESLNNIIRHARATAVGIRMLFQDEQVIIEISDNGKGFDTALVRTDDPARNGAGINNMKNRARLMQAGFDIASSPSQGTTITMTIPLHREKTEHQI